MLAVLVTPADTGDSSAGQELLTKVAARYHRIRLIWADAGYTGFLVAWCTTVLGLVLQIVRRNDDVSGFPVLPRRWIIERTNPPGSAAPADWTGTTNAAATHPKR